MSNVGDRMADTHPERARTKAEADRIQRDNERRAQEMLAEEDSPGRL